MRPVVAALVLAGLATAGWVPTPPAVPGAPHVTGMADAVAESPALPAEPDDDDRSEVRPRRERTTD